MKLYEYETKKILKEHNILTPKGETAKNPTKARLAASRLKSPFVVKAQVLMAGRGKAGGIIFANTPGEVEKAAEKLFEAKIKGVAVKQVLVEEKIPIKKELYVGITVDRAERKYALITSDAGGVDIEEVAEKAPERIVKTLVDSILSFEVADARGIAERMCYEGKQQALLADILCKFLRVGTNFDVELFEMNPLAETVDGKFVALDARLIMDDNALFRRKEYQGKLYDAGRERTAKEVEALKDGLAYVKLDGDIGVVGNGAGLVMATLDVIQQYGGRPADFLDLGGGASVERITAALEIVLSDPHVKSLFINILGGITRCDDVARGIIQAKTAFNSSVPIIVRLVGTNEKEGRRVLNEAGMRVLGSMEEAVQLAVKLIST